MHTEQPDDDLPPWPFCECDTDHTEEEVFSNVCSKCGKTIE